MSELLNSSDKVKTATSYKIELLEYADYSMQTALSQSGAEQLSVLQALHRIYSTMTKFEKEFPVEAEAFIFVQYWRASIAEAYNSIIVQAIPQDENLDYTTWHRVNFDQHLEYLSVGKNSIPKFLQYLDEHRELIPAEVSAGWNSAARKFHMDNGGNCGAGNGCPSTGCAAKALMKAIAEGKGVRDSGNNL